MMDTTEERPEFEMDDWEGPTEPYSVSVDDGCGYDRLSVPFPY
jgi:hypothetical protein